MSSDHFEHQDIVITVLGGCVTGVFTDIPKIRVIVLDWDNINEAPLETFSRGPDRNLPATLQQMPNDTRLAYRCSIAIHPST
jgi:hypothetical protein